MNIRKKQIKITIDGETKVYESIKQACEETGISHMTLYNWMTGKTKPRINIKVEEVTGYEKLLREAMKTVNVRSKCGTYESTYIED